MRDHKTFIFIAIFLHEKRNKTDKKNPFGHLNKFNLKQEKSLSTCKSLNKK